MAATYTEIASVTTAVTTPFVKFGNIPQTYTDLVLVYDFVASAGADYAMIFNDDIGNNYNRGYGFANVSTGGDSDGSNSPISAQLNAFFFGTVSSGTCNIMEYANTNMYKTAITSANINGTNNFVGLYVGTWMSTSGLTSITFKAFADPLAAVSTISAGSKFTLYGIRSA